MNKKIMFHLFWVLVTRCHSEQSKISKLQTMQCKFVMKFKVYSESHYVKVGKRRKSCRQQELTNSSKNTKQKLVAFIFHRVSYLQTWIDKRKVNIALGKYFAISYFTFNFLKRPTLNEIGRSFFTMDITIEHGEQLRRPKSFVGLPNYISFPGQKLFPTCR